MEEFFKEIQKLYIRNRSVECSLESKNGYNKIVVNANGEEKINVMAKSLHTACDLAYMKLLRIKEEIV